MSSKQLTVSADNLLSLQMDMCLTLSSSVPSGLDSSPVSLSAASAEDIYITKRKPVRQKRRVSSSTRRTPIVASEKRSCLATVCGDSQHSSSSDTLRQRSADVRTAESDLDSDAADVCCRDSTPPVSHYVMKLPRSGSNITRKKAFYNVKRPVSIVRRNSSSSTWDECLNVTS